MSWASVAAFVAGVLFVLNQFHYRPHLNSFGEMRGKIFELYSSPGDYAAGAVTKVLCCGMGIFATN